MQVLAVTSALLLLCVASLEAGYTYSRDYNEKALAYYTYTKTMNSCLGKDISRSYHKYIRETLSGCYSDYFAQLKKETKKAGKQKREAKQEPFLSSSEVARVEDEHAKYVSIVSCFFDGLKIDIRENGTICGKAIHEYVDSLHLETELAGYVQENIRQCELHAAERDFSRFGKVNEVFAKKLKFYRCISRGVLKSCVQFDFHHNEAEFDLSGLGDSLQGQSDARKRYAVFSQFANYDRLGIWDGVIPQFRD